MKLTLPKAAASIGVAAALLVAAPVAAAQAYVPTGPDTVTVTITADGPVGLSGFQPGATISFTLVGVGVTAENLAAASRPVTSTSITKVADSAGVATAVVTLPENPVGSYTLAATGDRAADNGGSGGSGSGAAGNGSNALPATGMNSESLLGIWVGGGALVLAGATVAVATKVRRNRQGSKA